ncbi:pyocin knob domain-containing protein, partial [Meridianimarinicoccus sp. RP-17]
MADLDEAAVFDAGIRQIETTDPVVGGPPNLSTFAGMANVPHLQLARRTRWLKDKIDNDLDIAGTTSKRGLLLLATSTEAKAGSNTAKALTPAAAADAFLRREVGTDSALDAGDNLDTITTAGIYRWLASSPVNAPSGLTQYAQMIVETDGSQPTQIVWGGLGGRVAVRRRNSGVWGTWNRMWSTEDAPAVLGTTGRQ